MDGYVFGVTPWRAFLILHRLMDCLGFGMGPGWDLVGMGFLDGIRWDLHIAYACGDFVCMNARQQ